MSIHPYHSRPNTPELDTDSIDEEVLDKQGFVEGENPVFWGKSSDVKLAELAMESVNDVINVGPDFKKRKVRKRDEYWDVQPVRLSFFF